MNLGPLNKLASLPAPGTLALVALLMLSLYSLDRWLAALENREVSAEARGLYARGNRLLSEGRAADAAASFQRAHSLDREDRAYQLALANAQLASGRPDDARATLEEVLDRDSNDGRANFLMARVLVAEHKRGEADSYYHRAIYGEWPENSSTERMKARLELAGLLAQSGQKQELLPEVLLLANEGAPMAKVAELYLDSGAAARAADAYRAIIRQNPRDGAAFAGMGKAELQRGDFRAAEAAFLNAQRYLPDDAQAAANVDLAMRLVEIDPTSRWLASAEKFRRSTRILELTEADISHCLNGQRRPPETEGLLQSAAQLRAQRMGTTPSNELAEERLSVAEQLWQARIAACGPPPAADVLAIIHQKLAQ